MFLKNCWYVAGFSEDASRTPFARAFLGTSVLIYRTEDGTAVAMDNHCPHRFAPLDQGVLVGDAIQCRYHGLRFAADGKCVHVPNGNAPPPRAQLRVYPIVERYATLWIWMGDAEQADPALVPDFAFLEDADLGWFNAYLHVKANYQLVVDNLLDLTHAEFLHPLLKSEGWEARNTQTVTQDGETIAVTNIAYDDPMIPLLRFVRPDMHPVGTWIQHERWDAPGNLVLNFEFVSGEDRIMLKNAHYLTPETETTAHYFIRGGHYDRHDDPAYTEQYKAGVIAIFASEDVPMLEAQQHFLGDSDLMDHAPAILKGDSAAIRARRLLAKKIRLEQTEHPSRMAI